MKRTYTHEERDLVFDLWKQGAGFSDIARVLDAKPGSIFTILREFGGIKPAERIRAVHHLTIEEREEIRAGLSAKLSIRAIARQLDRSPSTISREINRNRGRRWYKALEAEPAEPPNFSSQCQSDNFCVASPALRLPSISAVDP